MEPDQVTFVQVVHDDGEVSPPIAVCPCCQHPLGKRAVVKFRQDMQFRVQEWDGAGEVTDTLRELGFSE
jgi:hypothetical protein